jgi:hypothetical protein
VNCKRSNQCRVLNSGAEEFLPNLVKSVRISVLGNLLLKNVKFYLENLLAFSFLQAIFYEIDNSISKMYAMSMIIKR